MKHTLLLLIVSVGLVPLAHASSIFIPNDICTASNCTTQSSSYTGANAGTGENDYSGVIYKGTPDGGGPTQYDTFDGFGWVCTSTSGSADCSSYNVSYLSGNTGSVSLTEDSVETSTYYAFDDTFTAGASGFTGTVILFGNLSGLQESDSMNAGCSNPSSALLVECDDTGGLNNRPAIAFVAGNNTWAANHVSYSLEGDTAVFIFSGLSLGANDSLSLGFFTLLDGTGTGPYTGNPSQAITDGEAIQGNPDFSFAGGVDPQNFSSAPEPGTMGLVSVALIAGYFAARRRRA